MGSRVNLDLITIRTAPTHVFSFVPHERFELSLSVWKTGMLAVNINAECARFIQDAPPVAHPKASGSTRNRTLI
jgi:hypothetical protein